VHRRAAERSGPQPRPRSSLLFARRGGDPAGTPPDHAYAERPRATSDVGTANERNAREALVAMTQRWMPLTVGDPQRPLPTNQLVSGLAASSLGGGKKV
jgi:hypothetical protein